MAHFSTLPRFRRDYERLDPVVRERFERVARTVFAVDAARGTFRKGLRVKRVRSTKHVWEMTFAPDGRATWHYGAEQSPGVPHVVWRRVGDHGVLDDP